MTTGAALLTLFARFVTSLLAEPLEFEVASAHLLRPVFWNELVELRAPKPLVALILQASELDVLYRIQVTAGEASRARIVHEVQALRFDDLPDVAPPYLAQWIALLRKCLAGVGGGAKLSRHAKSCLHMAIRLLSKANSDTVKTAGPLAASLVGDPALKLRPHRRALKLRPHRRKKRSTTMSATGFYIPINEERLAS